LWDSVSSNDYLTFSCECATPSSSIWRDVDIEKLDHDDVERSGRCLTAKWCEQCGEAFCNAVLDGEQSAERAPQSNVNIKGTRKDVAVADVIAAMGPRSPAPSPNPPAWRVAFLYVTQGDPGDAAGIALVDSIRSQFEAYFPLSTEGRLSIETRLK
jgi:hypothetical protein